MKKSYRVCVQIIIFTAILISDATAQQRDNSLNHKSYNRFYLGFGLGQDYGGLGLKAEFLPVNSLGVFIGFGYNFVTPVYNTGISFKILPAKKITPTLLAMYGYNGAIKIKGGAGNIIHEKSYYGMTVGIGADFKYNAKQSKFSIAVLAPLRSSTFKNDYDGFKNAGFDFNPGVMPVTLSLGVNFALKDKKHR